MIITAAAAAEGEEERLTGSEANLFPPSPISGRIAPARIPRWVHISSYTASPPGSLFAHKFYNAAVNDQRSVGDAVAVEEVPAAAVGMLAADC